MAVDHDEQTIFPAPKHDLAFPDQGLAALTRFFPCAPGISAKNQTYSVDHIDKWRLFRSAESHPRCLLPERHTGCLTHFECFGYLLLCGTHTVASNEN